MKDEDPLVELRRYRDAMAKKFNYDVDAIGEYLRSVPLLPGQKWAKQKGEAEKPGREKQTRTKSKVTAQSAAAKPAKPAGRKTASLKKKAPAHASS